VLCKKGGYRTDLGALRVVVRRGFTHDLADKLVADIQRELPLLERQQAPVHGKDARSFAHV
jgi:glutamate decarboxylase